MKCGVEIDAQQSFCDNCLTGMEKHPVKPGTPVVLPQKAYAAPVKRSTNHRRPRRQEENISRLRIRLRLSAMLCVLLIAALALSVTYIWHLRQEATPAPPDPGQNYSTGSTAPSN